MTITYTYDPDDGHCNPIHWAIDRTLERLGIPFTVSERGDTHGLVTITVEIPGTVTFTPDPTL